MDAFERFEQGPAEAVGGFRINGTAVNRGIGDLLQEGVGVALEVGGRVGQTLGRLFTRQGDAVGAGAEALRQLRQGILARGRADGR